MALRGEGEWFKDRMTTWRERHLYGGFDVSHIQIYASDDQNNATEGGFYTVHCWPRFIPRWYKTHYASHYLSVRMPGNEMIHIQEGCLWMRFKFFLSFFFPLTTTCDLRIKVLLENKRHFDPWADAERNPRSMSDLHLLFIYLFYLKNGLP